MALINIGAGLSELGKTVAHTAAAWTLEDQRREADLEKAKLVDQLMAAREGTARRESHANALELEGRRQEFEKPHKEAQTAALRTSTARTEDEDRRKRETGEAVSGILSGGGGRFDSYGERLRGYEGGTKKGGMVDNELGSGAYGPFQFMPSTWGDVRKANPDLNLPEDMRQATAQQHKAAFDKFTATNADALQKAGIEPTAANLYLAHRFGAGGAQALIRADDGKLLSEVLPPEWQKQNPDMRGQTVAGFKRLAEERMKGVTLESRATGDDPALAALAKYDPKAALEIRERRREHEAALDQSVRAAARLQIGDEGIAYIINPQTKTGEPLMVDGQPLKFRDPDEAKRQTELIRTLSQQLTSAERSYMPDILATEATVRKLMTDPTVSVDKEKQRELAEAKTKAELLRRQYNEERAEPLAQLRRLGAQLTARTNKGVVTGEKPPLADLIKLPGQSKPGIVNEPAYP